MRGLTPKSWGVGDFVRQKTAPPGRMRNPLIDEYWHAAIRGMDTMAKGIPRFR